MYRMSRSLIYLLKKIDNQIQHLSRVLKYKFGREGENFERTNLQKFKRLGSCSRGYVEASN